ncbi:MAG TPA: dihydroorotase [Dongiaceae bacterium]|nr:dihydroorotase [Dongiaceae bacterium]
MSERFDLIIHGAIAATPNGIARADIGIRDGRFAAIGEFDGSAAETFDARGLYALPGVIDTQVHFREPGMTHKEDLATGTAAAVLGGVTAVFEMPNTNPNTLTAGDIADKVSRAKGRARCDIAFFVGAAAENAGELAKTERSPGCAGVKVFMGSSTGSLLVPDDETLEAVLRSGFRRVAIHSEDEARLRERMHIAKESGDVAMHPVWRDEETAIRATNRVLKLARETGRRVHLLHVTTAEEMAILAGAKDIATVEATPQHLTLAAPDCYRELGTLAQMNPPIRDARHREGLWQAVRDGVVDCIGSDHAPHTLEEKAKPYPTSPSGMAGVQTLLPLLLDHLAAGRLTLERIVDLTSAGPQRIYNIAGKGRIAVGYDADLVLVDLETRRVIRNEWIASRCGWTPFDGREVKGWPKATILRGAFVMREDELIGEPIGQSVRFAECLN